MNDTVLGVKIDRSLHTILVVDDAPATRYSTSRMLHAAGFRTQVATNGAEALAMNVDGISAVVLDVHLPDIDGFEVCRRWRDNPRTALLPVIHLSASFLEDKDKVEGLNSGADAYLTHPVEPAVLIATVQTLLRASLAESQLRKREEQLRLALDAADIGLWDVDTAAHTLYWPDRVKAMFGISANAAVSRADFLAGIHPADRAHQSLAFANACDPKQRTQYDVEYRTIGKEDQVVRWVASKGRAIFNDANECIRVIGTAIEITNRKVSEEALRESEERLRLSDRRKDEFLAMLAHELRNPLAPISAAAELIGMLRLDENRLHGTAQIISRQVNHLTDLLDDLLDVSRVTRGLVSLNMQRQDMNDVVASAAEQVAPTMAAKHHDFGIELSPHPVIVLGDKNRLVQIATNLLNNAAKYTPAGGRIRLTLEADADRVLLRVADNGIGIPEKLQPHVFELFTQADRSADRSQGGLGLGLALVKHLAELHAGVVTFESGAAGQGSCFTISLPLAADEHASVAEDGPRVADAARSTKALRILVVDDNVDAAYTLKMLLEALGHAVVTENGSTAALQRAGEDTPDVLLLDIGLPEMDGFELARRLRALPAGSGLTLIAVTGYGQEDDRIKAAEAGFDHHLTKPIDTARLKRLLSDAARKQKISHHSTTASP